MSYLVLQYVLAKYLKYLFTNDKLELLLLDYNVWVLYPPQAGISVTNAAIMSSLLEVTTDQTN